jgi:hypothetical protein
VRPGVDRQRRLKRPSACSGSYTHASSKCRTGDAAHEATVIDCAARLLPSRELDSAFSGRADPSILADLEPVQAEVRELVRDHGPGLLG